MKQSKQNHEWTRTLSLLMAATLIFGFMAMPLSAFAQTAAGKMLESGDDLFTSTSVVRFQIEIPKEGLETLRKYHWQAGREQRVAVKGTVREGDQVYRDVAIHLKGAAGSFRGIDGQPSFTLNFDKFVKGQTFHGLEKISLNNSVQDPTFLSEKISRELCAAAGIPAHRADHAVIELNGRKLGLYVLVEGFNKQFLRRHFKNANGNFYDGGFAQDLDQALHLDSGDGLKDHSDLKALIAAAQDPVLSNRWARLEKILDLDRFITSVAMDVLLCHWDGYALNRNNYRVYHDPDSGKFVFMPHGMDQMFGWQRVTPQMAILPGTQMSPDQVRMLGSLARAVVQIPEGRRRYLNQLGQLVTNVLKAEVITKRVRELAAEIQPAIAERGPQAAKEHARQVANLCERITQRAQSVKEQLAAPRDALEFDAAGTARLAGWKRKIDFQTPTFTEMTDSASKARVLRISTERGSSVGSWQVKTFLDGGRYRLEGKVKTQGVTLDPGDRRGGAGFRIGTRRQLVSGTTDWTTLGLDFEMPEFGEVELLGELRAAKGEVWFDADSLKLIRK